MLQSRPEPPEGIHLLADHLDAALAAGEDLMALRLAPMADLPPTQSADAALAEFVSQLRRGEAALLLRLLQARRRATEVESADPALRSVLRLIATSTEALVDLIEHYGRRDADSFEAGGDLQHELRRRGLIPAEAAAVGPFEAVNVGDGMLIGGVVALGSLLDVSAAALDLLDRQFDLYVHEVEDEAEVLTSSGEEPADRITACPLARRRGRSHFPDEIAAWAALPGRQGGGGRARERPAVLRLAPRSSGCAQSAGVRSVRRSCAEATGGILPNR